MRATASAALALLCVLVISGCRSAHDPLPGFPRLMLWAWERPEDLRFLDPRNAGVAYLAETVFLRRTGAEMRPRLQPLRIAPGTKLMAVVRIESAGGPTPDVNRAADLVAGAATQPDVSALQLDYDAVRGERPFYRRLAAAVRARMPSRMPLTMTALVSWCISDPWIRGLPVSEATPMYFRMGPEPRLRTLPLRNQMCLGSIGLSTDELVRVPVHGRVFVFNPRPWTREALYAAVAEVNRW
ncbi:MAG TPA: hypothetical protein VFA04_11370 [Bryobacteraceae bacterium]|nr:hypothetical protein [Bryobacteraceae bacterium]